MSQIARRRAAAAASAESNPAYAERVRLIRQAASKVFHEKGFHGTKLNDVAEEAGVDRASLYYYVGSKEQLFRDVVAEAVTGNIDKAETLVASDLPAPEKLSRLVKDLMDSFDRHYPFMYVFVQEDMTKLTADDNNEGDWLTAAREWNARYFKAVRQIILDGINDGSIKTALPAGVVANCVIGMINSSSRWYRPEGLMDAFEIGEGLSDILLSGLAR
ncbi:TetR/AcrR family transcriptional regulator [Nocardioides humi]|uniref:TetR/AcrR family transcriptional regulator n=1 Tax=Nocardioides humi TaxID=449461 RepID=A0ABN2AE98_9ACTN|nr:TetR/AcrR family transcriptional regulator [Nocardioides humi]